jgi:hypothetical protein
MGDIFFNRDTPNFKVIPHERGLSHKLTSSYGRL